MFVFVAVASFSKPDAIVEVRRAFTSYSRACAWGNDHITRLADARELYEARFDGSPYDLLYEGCTISRVELEE